MDDQVLPLHNSAQPRHKEPEDLQKLRQWQQQRLQRRLRGDYESAVIHLSHVVCFFDSCPYPSHDSRLTTISTHQLV